MTNAQPSPYDISEITVAAARAGDHAAIGALGAAAFRRIVTFYRYTGVQIDHAEDLAADAVESIISGLPNLRSVNRYDAWMWSIARNRLRDFWRAKPRMAVLEPISPSPAQPDELVILNEEHATIRLAIQQLSLRDQELLWLREVLGLDYRSIAERVGTSAATTRVACHRARAHLQTQYERIENLGRHTHENPIRRASV